MIETYKQIDSGIIVFSNLGFPGGSAVKNLPAMQQTWVQSLGREDSLEKEMATHSSILAWESPWTEEPGNGVAKSQTKSRCFYIALKL